MPPPISLAIEAVKSGAPNQDALIRKAMESLVTQLKAKSPDFNKPQERDELLVQSLAQTKDIVTNFYPWAEIVAECNSQAGAISLYKSFNLIMEMYFLPRKFAGGFNKTDFDFYKFLGHELFVTFISALIKNDRWELIANVLSQDLYVPNYDGQPATVHFYALCEYLQLLAIRNDRLNLNRASVHADILNERHTSLAFPVPMEAFMEADYFLALRSDLPNPKPNTFFWWRPWSSLYLDHAPSFLTQAQNKVFAQRLVQSLGIDSIQQLRDRLIERSEILSGLFGPSAFHPNPLRYLKASEIATQ